MTTKRLLDVVLSAAGLVLLSPVFCIVGAAVWATSKGPVLFKQSRIGKDGKTFVLLKFRSMHVDGGVGGLLITASGDPRITRIGRMLRRTKLDELPQFVNVLRGEMSLVGPRPEVPELVAFYTMAEREVLRLTPGITDPATLAFQHEEEILGRASDPMDLYLRQVMPRKIEMNLEYARSATVASDLGVLLTTGLRVVLRRDIPVRRK